MRVASHVVTTAAMATSVDARNRQDGHKPVVYNSFGECERVTLCIESEDNEEDDRLDPWRGFSGLRCRSVSDRLGGDVVRERVIRGVSRRGEVLVDMPVPSYMRRTSSSTLVLKDTLVRGRRSRHSNPKP